MRRTVRHGLSLGTAALFDTINNVIHCPRMLTNTRGFLRNFADCKARARRGEIVRIQDKEGEFLFSAATPKKSLIGIAKGKIMIHGDLTKPTLPNHAWRPSL